MPSPRVALGLAFAVFALLSARVAPAQAPTAPATAREHRVAVVIGNDVGDPTEPVLEWAESDARRVRDLLVEAGGVEPDRMVLVTGGGANEVRRALAEAVGRIAELRRLGSTALLVYVSSHADEANLHLGGDHLALSELEDLLRSSQAHLRLAIIDACRSAVRTKGGRPGPEVALAFGAASKVEGEVMITAAGPGEPAQEWAGLRGSLFTHHLLAGLRGLADADGDRRVTLAEIYGYSFRRTVAYSTNGPVPQHPSFTMDTRGFGEWTVTRPPELGATLTFARDLAGPIWVTDLDRRELVAEIAKSEGEISRLSVRPRKCRIVRPAGAFSEVADVNMTWGGERTIGPSDLVRTTAARATLRGGAPLDLRPWRLGAGYRFSTGVVKGALTHGGSVTLERDAANYLLRVRTTLGASAFTAGASTIHQSTLELGAGAAFVVPAGPTELHLGLELVGTWALQTFSRADGQPPEPNRTAIVPGTNLFAKLALPLGDELRLEAELAPGLHLPPLYDGTRGAHLSLEAQAAAHWSF